MAATSLHVASAGVAVGDAATGTGITVAKVSTTAGIGVARGAVGLGLGIARFCVAAPAAVLEVAGPGPVSHALRRADSAIAGAHSKADGSLSGACDKANTAMSNARSSAGDSMGKVQEDLTATARSNALYLRVILGSDTTEVILAAQGLVQEFSGPFGDVRKMDLFRAAKAWASLQRAALAEAEAAEVAYTAISADTPTHAALADAVGLTVIDKPLETALPEDSERWMRFTAAAFGAAKAGSLLNNKYAQLELQQKVRRQILSSGSFRGDVRADVSPVEATENLDTMQSPNHDDGDDAKFEDLMSMLESMTCTIDALAGKNSVEELDAALEVEDDASGDIESDQEASHVDSVPATPTEDADSALTTPNEAWTLVDGLSAPEVVVELVTSETENPAVESPTLSKREQQQVRKLESRQAKEARAAEKQALKEVKKAEKQSLKEVRMETKREAAVVKAQNKEAKKASNFQRKEALNSAKAYWNTLAGRAEAALICAGIDSEGIETIHFEEDTAPAAGEPHVPGQIVAVDHLKGCVVVCFRGSSCLRDALVDLDCKPEQVTFCGREGIAHGGMIRSARKLEQPLADVVDIALAKLTGPKRVLVLGHSLGAGVAALITALWHEGNGRFPQAEVRCLAYACPQVLDAEFAEMMREHTTTYVAGQDCVPCLSLATATDLRDALVILADPEAQGLTPVLRADEILAAAERGEMEALAANYHTIRRIVGSTAGRLYPAGRLVRLASKTTTPSCIPKDVPCTDIDEMVVTTDMVLSHMPGRYLQAVQEAVAAAPISRLWGDKMSIASAVEALPKL